MKNFYKWNHKKYHIYLYKYHVYVYKTLRIEKVGRICFKLHVVITPQEGTGIGDVIKEEFHQIYNVLVFTMKKISV